LGSEGKSWIYVKCGNEIWKTKKEKNKLIKENGK